MNPREFAEAHRELVTKVVTQDMDRIGQALFKEHGEIMKTYTGRVDALQERLEEIEAKASSPGRAAPLSTKAREHKTLFEQWVRKPSDPARLQRLANFEDAEFKDVTVGTGAAGGFAMPEEISRQIGLLEQKFSPVRRLVNVARTSSGDYKMLVDVTGATSGWVAETGTRTATATPQLRERVPTFGELYAYPQASEWSLDDIFFNVEQWLAQSVAREFAQEEGLAVISGDGSAKPTGMLNTAPVATADFASPPRSANAYQLVDSDMTPGGAGVVGDALKDLVYTVNSAYRSNGSFTMNSLTAGHISKLKDAEGRYLWQDSLAAGQPARLLGYPVAIWEQMPDVGAGNFPVAFGDFQRGYQLVDRTDIRITRDPYTLPGFVRFYVRRRVGGHVWDNAAIKWLRTV
jgi:HK97 family phage major capsid protein